MENRVALVTGAAKRVGRAIAHHLAQGGFDIAFTYHSSGDEARALENELRHLGRRVVAVRADLTDPDTAVPDVVRGVTGEFDRLDVLVNNASLYLPANLAQTTPAVMRKVMAIHFESPLMLAQAFEAKLRASRGHIVSMSDLLADRPWPQYLAYCASKAALSNLTKGLAKELAPGVTVNAIAPGVVEWPEDYPEAEREKYLRRVPLGREGSPEEVARLVQFLVTEGAYITGQIIPLDGGRSVT
ncbi:MAG TPA: SDR family oxidoreductase [Tepidisphaeraceae bacterium]|nr:SDR family oxidoreductase [Tepidisphaeraceae bacterium]